MRCNRFEHHSHAVTAAVAFTHAVAFAAAVAFTFTAAVGKASCRRRSAPIEQWRSRWCSYRGYCGRGRHCIWWPVGGFEFFQRRCCSLFETRKDQWRRASLYDRLIQWLRISAEVIIVVSSKISFEEWLPLSYYGGVVCVSPQRYDG